MCGRRWASGCEICRARDNGAELRVKRVARAVRPADVAVTRDRRDDDGGALAVAMAAARDDLDERIWSRPGEAETPGDEMGEGLAGRR
jgi:hypothetical protein